MKIDDFKPRKLNVTEEVTSAEWPFQINELSNDKLGQYKKAAAADASAADKRGDFKHGDKRFSGIVKATKKQFANDVKKHYDGKEKIKEDVAQLKTGDVIGYRPKGAKMIPIKAKVLSLLRDGKVMVRIYSPSMIAQNGGNPVITIDTTQNIEIQNPYRGVVSRPAAQQPATGNPNIVMKEAAQDWLPAYNALVKNDGEPARGGNSGNLNWKKSMALSAKDNAIGGEGLRNFVKQYAQNGHQFGLDSRFNDTWNQLVTEIWSLMKQAPTMDEMRNAVKQQAADTHQGHIDAIQQQLDLEKIPLQHELSVQALLHKAELDKADMEAVLQLDVEARQAILRVKQELELDAKERLVAIEREIEDRKERDEVRKHELEMAQTGYKHELAVITATAEGEYKKAKLEADFQIQVKQLENIDNAGERQNRLDQINTEKEKQLAIIDSETKARVEVLQKEVDVERQQSDIEIEKAFMMTFNPIWGVRLAAAATAGKTWQAAIKNINKALSMLASPVMPKPQRESAILTGIREATTDDPKFQKMSEGIKQRLDAKCWKGKHKEGTKIKGGVRVNNCVPNESVAEGKKVDSFVAHVKSSEKKAGHSNKEAEDIAWATANKRGMLDNKNKKKVHETIEPISIKEILEGLDDDQKRVGQVGGKEKAKKIGTVLGTAPKKHPFNKRLVGE